jgi:hypothetical protein
MDHVEPRFGPLEKFAKKSRSDALPVPGRRYVEPARASDAPLRNERILVQTRHSHDLPGSSGDQQDFPGAIESIHATLPLRHQAGDHRVTLRVRKSHQRGELLDVLKRMNVKNHQSA